MKLLDLITAPWAIAPEKLREIQAIYSTHLRGDKIDIDAIEARLGRPLANEQQDYQIMPGGVAVLTLEGVMAPKANLFMRISGGVSTQIATKQIESAIVDPRVTAIVLSIDSPGGSVFGTPELGATVRELSNIKPIVTVSEATLASAAYWIASASNAIYISGPTVQVGSIGVATSHSYDPKAAGTTTEITAGKYKRMASDKAPLSAEGLAYMQSHVDHLYSVFVDAVAAYRGTTPDAVLEHMADGRIFIGQQAIDAGLVDGFSTVDAMVEQLATNPAKFSTRRKAKFALGALPSPAAGPAGALAHADETTEPVLLTPVNPQTQGTITMDRATLQQAHPALFAQLQTEFRAEGATAERTRIQDVESATIPGHEALIASFKFDGKTTGGDAALAVNKAERDIRIAQGKSATADAPKPVASVPAPTVEASMEAKTTAAATAEAQRVAALPLDERCKAQWEASATVRAEFASLADYTALTRAEEAGRVRVLGKKAA
jgi:signal peptide peptidase SppA